MSFRKKNTDVTPINTIIISRTDAIGDVVLTLPVATLIKEITDGKVKVLFFGKTYTQPVTAICDSIDGFINYDDFKVLNNKSQSEFLRDYNADAIIHVFPRIDIAIAAKQAGIQFRIGTTNRFYHWFNCNRLVRLSRKKSDLHESQLNIKLLKPLGYKKEISLGEIASKYHLTKTPELPRNYHDLLSKDKFKLVIHPKSNASSREWKPDYYRDLINSLPSEKFQFILTGGENETGFLNEWHKALPSHVINVAGKLNLDELISMLNACNGIIASSTGPLHIAAALGRYALGIFPPIRPMNPSRWAPVGVNAGYLVIEKECNECRFDPGSCHCINEVTPNQAARKILSWLK